LNIFVVCVHAVAQRALKNKYESSEQKDHWLYYADDKYDVSVAILPMSCVNYAALFTD